MAIYTTRGLMPSPSNENDDKDNEWLFEEKEAVEEQPPRKNGKRLCEKLKEMRRKLAKANHIPFETPECPVDDDSCAGTCAQCDAEMEYLQECLEKKKKEERVYPRVDIETDEDKDVFTMPPRKPEEIIQTMGLIRPR